MQRLLRWVAGLIGLAALLLALGIGAFRLAIEMLPGYQERIVERVREATGLTLEFDSVYAPDRPAWPGDRVPRRPRAARIGRRAAGHGGRGAREPFDSALDLVPAARGRARRVRAAAPRFVITADGRIRLVGQSALQRPETRTQPMTLDRLPRGRFAVTDAVLDVLDLRARQGRFQLTGADIELVRKGDDVTLTGRVDLPEHLGSVDRRRGRGGRRARRQRRRRLARRGSRRATSTSVNGRRCCRTAFACRRRATVRSASPRAAPGRAVDEPAAAARTRGPAPARSSTEAFSRIAGDIRVQRDDEHDLGRGHRSRAVAARRALAARRASRRGSRARTGASSRRPSRARTTVRIENLAALAAALPPGALRERIDDARPARRIARSRPDRHGRRRAAAAGHHRPPAFLRHRVRPVRHARRASPASTARSRAGAAAASSRSRRAMRPSTGRSSCARRSRSCAATAASSGSDSTPASGSGSTTHSATAATAARAASCAWCCVPANCRSSTSARPRRIST